MISEWEKPPKTDAALFDVLARLFGYGTYDELESALPYWEYRRTEISKVVASRRKADVSLVEAYRIALYCKEKGLVITGPAQIYRWRMDARRWWAEQQKEQVEAEITRRLDDAIAAEMEIPGSPWVERFMRASGQHREEVLQEWEHSRSSKSVRRIA